jgi:hypothetical protein
MVHIVESSSILVGITIGSIGETPISGYGFTTFTMLENKIVRVYILAFINGANSDKLTDS